MNGDGDDSDGGDGDDDHDDGDDDDDDGDGQPDGPHIPCNFTHRGTTLAGIGQLIHIVSRSYICLSLNSFYVLKCSDPRKQALKLFVKSDIISRVTESLLSF